MPEICGERVSRQQAEGVSLAGDLVGNASIGSPLLFVHFLKCIHYFVSIGIQ
jgi:hypothetical protein